MVEVNSQGALTAEEQVEENPCSRIPPQQEPALEAFKVILGGKKFEWPVL